jgi:hypothetical protein
MVQRVGVQIHKAVTSQKCLSVTTSSLRGVRYAYVYLFGEALAGILMIAGAFIWIAIPVALVIRRNWSRLRLQGRLHRQTRTQMRLRRRRQQCALGLVSLTENLMMVAMAVGMIFKG